MRTTSATYSSTELPGAFGLEIIFADVKFRSE